MLKEIVSASVLVKLYSVISKSQGQKENQLSQAHLNILMQTDPTCVLI